MENQKKNPSRRKCPSCGKETRTTGLFCPSCSHPMDPKDPFYATKPDSVPSSDTGSKEAKPVKKNHFFWLIAAIVAAVLITLWVNNTERDKAQQAQRIAELEAAAQTDNSGTTAYVPADTTTYQIYSGTADTSGKVTEQSYVPHPRYYQETGTEGTKTFKNLVVNNDEYLIVGGTSVNGTNNGVYRGYGPGTYTIKVSNGFVSIVDDDWGAQEFDFRVAQAIEYGWAHSHINRGPIPE